MAPIIRIALRYLSGFLIAKGFLGDTDSELLADPELVSIIESAAGLIIAIGTEYWYKLARRLGWEK